MRLVIKLPSIPLTTERITAIGSAAVDAANQTTAGRSMTRAVFRASAVLLRLRNLATTSIVVYVFLGGAVDLRR